MNATVTAPRFFFKVTLGRREATDQMRFVREPRKPPVLLSPEAVARLRDAAPGLKHKAALSVGYGAAPASRRAVSGAAWRRES